MQVKPYLTAQDARMLADSAEHAARSHGLAVTVAIVDDGGHALLLQRMDGAAPMTAEMAQGKARTAALARRPSKMFEDLVNGQRPAFLSASSLDCLVEGGVPFEVDGHVVGAVGVAGARSHEDALLAQVAIDAFLAAQN